MTQTMLVLAAIVVVAGALSLLFGRLERREKERHDAVMRRIGWGYGYGAGWVDCQKGVYEPGAPADGRTRPTHGARQP